MTIYTGEFTVRLFDAVTRVEVQMGDDWRTNLDFNCMGRAYSFCVTRWCGRGLSNFICVFHAHRRRDETEFGKVFEDQEGNRTVEMTRTQKINMMRRACQDLMRCLDLIGQRYARSMLDYAVWYREEHPERDTYAEYITL